MTASIEEARDALRGLPRPLGFVPTMGALHEGHLRLLDAARADNASVAASVFVNPLQFAPGEDYERYPRDPSGDRAKLEAAGVALLFAPAAAEMFPPGFATAVEPGPVGARFEGASRPTHFRGVATVVTKLSQIVRPDALYLGQKDAQQTAVLRRVVRDLAMPVRVEVVPTVREFDGLALSSRNAYLNSEQRRAAPSLHAALRTMLDALRAGAPAAEARLRALAVLAPLAQPDYLALVDADSFEPLDHLRAPAFVIGAARFGATRLLDNLWIAA